MQGYIHIPFCESKCKYCRFASIWNTQRVQIERYYKYLLKEIESFSGKTEPLSTLYFWWGTPSTFSVEQIRWVIDILKQKFWFQKDIEITLEATPSSIAPQYIDAVYCAWVNRISMWVQTLNTKSLEEIGRWNKSDIYRALEILRESQIKNISIDFIIWLPYVERWEVLQDIQKITWDFPCITHISVYMLEEYYEPEEKFWDQSDSDYNSITYPTDWKKIWIAEDEYETEYVSVCKWLKKLWFEKSNQSFF